MGKHASIERRMSRAVLVVFAWFLFGGLGARLIAEEPAASDKAGAEAEKAAEEPKKPREPIYDEKADGQAQIDTALKLAARDNKRVLVKFGGNWCGWCFKLHDVFTKEEPAAELVADEYVLVMIDVHSNEKLLEKLDPEKTVAGYPFLIVLDSAGEVLVRQNTEELEEGPRHDVKKVIEFLRKWAPEKKDAAKVLEQAIAEARRDDKRVLVHLGAPSCGWCHRLTELLAELNDEFARDYVVVKIDTARMSGGEEIEKRLRQNGEGGIPWIVILDSSAKELITSDGPKGNIGCPVFEHEIEHFMVMLERTRQRIGKEDLARLRQKIFAKTEPWRRKIEESRASE